MKKQLEQLEREIGRLKTNYKNVLEANKRLTKLLLESYEREKRLLNRKTQ